MKAKVWAVSALAVTSLIALSACDYPISGQPEAVPPATIPTQTQPAPQTQIDTGLDQSQIYLDTINDEGILPTQTDQYKLDMGQMVCGEIAKGKTMMGVANVLMARPYKLSAHDAGYVYGAASNTICRHVS